MHIIHAERSACTKATFPPPVCLDPTGRAEPQPWRPPGPSAADGRPAWDRAAPAARGAPRAPRPGPPRRRPGLPGRGRSPAERPRVPLHGPSATCNQAASIKGVRSAETRDPNGRGSGGPFGRDPRDRSGRTRGTGAAAPAGRGRGRPAGRDGQPGRKPCPPPVGARLRSACRRRAASPPRAGVRRRPERRRATAPLPRAGCKTAEHMPAAAQAPHPSRRQGPLAVLSSPRPRRGRSKRGKEASGGRGDWFNASQARPSGPGRAAAAAAAGPGATVPPILDIRLGSVYDSDRNTNGSVIMSSLRGPRNWL